MSIRYSIHTDGDLLRVVASGKDDDLNDVNTYGSAVVAAAQSTGCRRVLCDERDLQYSIGTIDIYESAEFMAQQARWVMQVAIVAPAGYEDDADFWETVAVNRGLRVRMFRRIEDAERWLGIEDA
jgi:hypothetical protein